MRKNARRAGFDAEQPLLFSDRPTIAERTAAGELCDLSHRAKANGFRWPLAVSTELCQQIRKIPKEYAQRETVAARWRHVLTLAASAAAQMIRERLEQMQVNVVLRTTNAPEKSREHFKALHLSVERSAGSSEVFALGCGAGK